MKAFDQCPACGGELIEKQVEKLLRGGDDVATVRVPAEVCTHCGERLYSVETIQLFEEIQSRLAQKQTKGFQLLGQSFLVEV